MTRTGIVNLTDPRLNKINDQFPGGGTESPGLKPGQLGQILEVSDNDVLYDSTVGTLYGGRYQYVKFVPQGGDTTPAVGLVVYWLDRAAKTVTSIVTGYDIAGILVNVVTDNYHCLICIDGKVKIQMAAAVTKAAPAKGDLLIAVAAAVVDVLLDATGLSSVEVARVVGRICDDGVIAADGALVQAQLLLRGSNF